MAHARRTALLLLAAWLAGCATARVYSQDPLAADGSPLPLGRVTALLFEDGGFEEFDPPLALRVEDGEFLAADGRRWAAAQVEAVEVARPGGGLDELAVLTPDDLAGSTDPPRLEALVTRDGERVEFPAGRDGWRWSTSGLGIVLLRGPAAGREFALDEVQRIELYRPSLLDATVKSPAFWVAAAVGVGLFVWVQQDPDDRELAIQ